MLIFLASLTAALYVLCRSVKFALQAYDKGNEMRQLASEGASGRAEKAHVEAPSLDTSHMLLLPHMTEGSTLLGTFGTRCGYPCMHVIDRDSREYVCFMTDHNVEALWTAEFTVEKYSPDIVEQGKGVRVGNRIIGIYPWFLRNYPHDSIQWRRWAELDKEFKAFRKSGGDHFHTFNKYYDGTIRREKV